MSIKTVTFSSLLADVSQSVDPLYAADANVEAIDEYVTLTDHKHELANANATVEMAMARIEALETENARLREVLKPFAKIANLNGFPKDDVILWQRSSNEPGQNVAIKLSDCKKAHEALNDKP